MTLRLEKPSLRLLPSYIEAIREGIEVGIASRAAAEEIESDPEGYIKRLLDAQPFTVTNDTGQSFAVTDHEVTWITDGSRYIGTLDFRYSGNKEFLDHVAGHRGMVIRPSLRHQGYGGRAWRDTFEAVAGKMKERGWNSMHVTCRPDNKPSEALIKKAGGQLISENENSLGFGSYRTYKITFE